MPIIPPIVQRGWVDGSGPEPEAVRRGRALQVRVHDARLDDRGARLGVDRQHVAEVLHGVDDDARADGVARDRGAGAAHRDRDAERPGRVEHGEDLVGLPRPDDHLRHDPVERGVAGVERPREGRVVDVGDSPAAQLLHQIREVAVTSPVFHRGADDPGEVLLRGRLR